MINLFTIGPIKDEIKLLPRYFETDDTLGGVNNRHIPHLEEKFSKQTNRQATSVNSCTNGIYLALKKLQLNQDPVLVTPIIFFGVGSAILKAGGVPILSAVNQDGIMCEKSVERALNSKYFGKKIKCIIPAHINGRYFETSRFENEVTIVEDSAPSFGIRKRDQSCLISSSKNVSIISFSFAKPLTAGEGGMIFSNSETSDWIKAHRYCGLDKMVGRYGIGDFEVTDPDLKFPFNALSAMLILVKLRKFEEDLQRRATIAHYLNTRVGSYNSLEFYPGGNHLTYMIRTKNRSQLEAKLKNSEIGFYYNHKPIFYFEAFKDLLFTSPEDRLQVEDYFQQVIHLPCRQDLTELESEKIADSLQSYFTLSSC